uniref:Carboxylesterase type B domain-containing protein n=1 Tax=Mycena chlorophos TaxID=658473 RepID=A0ABQ0KVU6_MYCCL|nr:predicted protein [Mycena chlorophos]
MRGRGFWASCRTRCHIISIVSTTSRTTLPLASPTLWGISWRWRMCFIRRTTTFFKANYGTATYLGPGAPIADRFLAVYMSRSWAAFVATGDPNNANVSSKVHWPRYNEGAENMVWQTRGSFVEKDNFRAEQMKYIADNILV